jgi:DNA-binding NarL/FixJ family response regulator
MEQWPFQHLAAALSPLRCGIIMPKGRAMAPLTTIFVDANNVFRGMAVRLFERHFPDHLCLVGTFANCDELAEFPAEKDIQLALLGLGSEGLLDTHMLNGLRHRWPTIAVVVLLHLNTERYCELALAAGADAVIAKEQIAIALLPALEQVFHGRSTERQ